jgi:hypothetical protein
LENDEYSEAVWADVRDDLGWQEEDSRAIWAWEGADAFFEQEVAEDREEGEARKKLKININPSSHVKEAWEERRRFFSIERRFFFLSTYDMRY